MQTDETIDRYFYITGWICIAVFAALAAVIGVCGTQKIGRASCRERVFRAV